MVVDRETFKFVAGKEPIKVYRKAIPARVQVLLLDPYQGLPEVVILHGVDREPTCFVELYTDAEVRYFESKNRLHLERGTLILDNKPRDAEELITSPNSMTDEEVEELMSKKWMAFKNVVDTITSEATIQRVIKAASDADKPIKTMEYLNERLSLIQSGDLNSASTEQ